jgi:hypothetical protein
MHALHPLLFYSSISSLNTPLPLSLSLCAHTALSNDDLVLAGEGVVEAVDAHKSVPVNVQCVMMRAMIQQMKDSCYYDSSRSTYVPVAALLMSGFNDASNEPKDNFVLYCVVEGLVDSWVEDYLG